MFLIYPRLKRITRRRVVSYGGVRVYEIASALVYRALPIWAIVLGASVDGFTRWLYEFTVVRLGDDAANEAA